MQVRENQKTTALICVVICCIHFIGLNVEEIATSQSAAWYTHFVYHFVHVNWLHVALNLVAFYLLRPSLRECALAFAAATIASFAYISLSVGLSAVIAAILGLRCRYLAADRENWNSFVLGNIVSAYIADVSFTLHVVAFGLGYLILSAKEIWNDYYRRVV